ncbi:MAG: hypothetical protein WBV94_05960 [Blastocatellia bacterium]
MNLKQFKSVADLVNRSEIEKVELLAFFYLNTQSMAEFSLADARDWFKSLGFSDPNPSRLRQNLTRSRDFNKGLVKDSFRLSPRSILELEKAYSSLTEEHEEVEVSNTILPLSLLSKTRGYIDNLGRQINASYDHKIYDGTALLMRKLIEILLIHTYQHLGLESTILMPNNRYKDLSNIIADAISNKSIGLTKDTKECLDVFRELGNFSAHKVFYNCRRHDIKNIAMEYRAAIEELLYKSGLKK